MAPKRKKKLSTGFSMMFAIFFAVAALAVSAFMLRSINTDIEDYSMNIVNPNQPQQTMPQPAKTSELQPTPTPATNQEPIETVVSSPPAETQSEAPVEEE